MNINSLSPEQYASIATPSTRTQAREVTPETTAAITRGVPVTITNTPVRPATARAARALVTAAAKVRPTAITVDGPTVRYLEGTTWMIAGRLS